MEIFGVPIYLNSLSVACMLPTFLGLIGGVYVLLIKKKTTNSWQFGLTTISLSLFTAAYAFATAVTDAQGVYHRFLTVSMVLPMSAFYFYFTMTYSEDIFPRVSKMVFRAMLALSPFVTIYFVFGSLNAQEVFRASGQFWDYDMPVESQVVGAFILLYGIVALIFGIAKFFKMKERHNAQTFLNVCIAMNSYLLPSAVLNMLSRKGVVTTDFFLWVQALGTTFAFFSVFVVFLSHTKERTTVVGNLLGITLVSVITFITLLSYPVIEDKKESFRTLWQVRLSSAYRLSLFPDLVFVAAPYSGANLKANEYFKDNDQYYRKAIEKLPADGVVLRADKKGGVYTFNALINGQLMIVGIELLELRKHIHPMAAKLVLAQVIAMAAVIGLFPFFFKGILIKPMRRLLDGVIAISGGSYDHRVANNRSDELGVISRHFNTMAQTIEKSTTRLEETVAQRTAQLSNEKQKSDALLLNILPEKIATELKETGRALPVRIESATVVFTDFVGFTQISEQMRPEEVVAELDKCFSYFDQVTEKYGLEKLKTIGDSFMCAGGVPESNGTHAIDACLAALEIQSFMNQMKTIKHEQGFPYWELRLGINTGPLVAGVVGHKKFAYDVWGDTVNTASRMESGGLPGEINISRSTFEIVKDWFICEYRGRLAAKNKGEIEMYLLKGLRRNYSVDSDGRVPNKEMKKAYVSARKAQRQSARL